MAGLWRRGGGTIIRPRGDDIEYLPRMPYLPPGSLREVLAYPAAVEKFADDAFSHALGRLDLSHLVPRLDQVRRWDRELSGDSQQRLAVARALLHAPRWIFIDEVLDILDEKARERVVDVLTQDLKTTGVIHFGREAVHDGLFVRTLHLINDT
jgi:putative ATP-binding cassette transporter